MEYLCHGCSTLSGVGRHRVRGLTLIELLVVLGIIGTLSAVVGLGLGAATEGRPRAAVYRLASTLEAVALEARISGRRLAWSVDRDLCQFWERSRDGSWRELAFNGVADQQRLPAGLLITGVSWEGRAVAAQQRMVFGAKPPVMDIELAAADLSYRLRSSPTGRVAVTFGTATVASVE